MPISLEVTALPYYAGRSLLRMFLALGASLVFALAYGYAAAFWPRARVVLLPVLDILQSVPILGFLAITVVGFMALFPGNLLGLELAAIFAIFTSMAWNLAFSVYHSLTTLSRDIREAAAIFRLGAWQRFTQLELPSAMLGLVWNGMMSFGGAWFFLAASEAITVLNKDFKLPGIGSYIATAVEVGSLRAIGLAVVAMILVIVGLDGLFWRPIVAWAQKFKVERTEAVLQPRSAVLTLLQRSVLVAAVYDRLIVPLGEAIDLAIIRSHLAIGRQPGRARLWRHVGRLGLVGLLVLVVFGLWQALPGAVAGVASLEPAMVGHAVYLGGLTMVRVMAVVAFASLIWTPVGVWIGLNPRVARVAQPVVQVLAAFPAILLFPVIAVGFLRYGISLDWGGVLLMALGSQWYILFNVIAGAMAIPTDLKEAAAIFGLRGWRRWRALIMPGIFPFWVTGGVTAAGGAWNAAIVAEVVSWRDQTLVADGLGAFITQATTEGHWPQIALGITVMSLYVVGFNRLLWRPLYDLAERKYRLDP